MKRQSFAVATVLLLAAALVALAIQAGAAEPLPSWKDGSSKQAIVEFVGKVTREGGPDYVAPPERIAVFDNDGTLWSEQPYYFQIFFALDRVKQLAPQHPEWKDQQPFAAALAGDTKGVVAGGVESLLKLIVATHAGNTTEEFERLVTDWIATAKHPRFNRPFTDLTFQPMLELLDYLRANGFETYIVSGGGVEFMRPWAGKVYGVPPQQVVGSSIKTKFEERDGTPVLVRLPEIDFIDDKAGKPVGINMHIGRRPILAFGNSDGDLQMLQWTAAGGGARFMGVVHHHEAERELAYKPQASSGHLYQALDEARTKGWTVVSMKDEWTRIFAFDESK
jgi:hypothetical protein